MIKEFSWNGHIEKARLVSNFSDIKIGKIYWEENCNQCTGLHRYFTINNKKFFSLLTYNLTNGFDVIPQKQCKKAKNDVFLTKNSFEITKIYEVINEIEDINREISEEFLDRKLFV